MNLEQQVCSLELAKRLKELGVKQDGHFAWYLETDGEMYLDRNMPGKRRMTADNCSAFTVAELGEMLPEEVEVSEKDYYFSSQRTLGNQWEASYRNSVRAALYESADTEADARAKMLIYLLENKLITV